MNNTSANEGKSFSEVIGASSLQGIAALAAIALAIIGLCGILPVLLTSITSIVLGGALLIGGGTVAAKYSDLFTDQGISEGIIGIIIIVFYEAVESFLLLQKVIGGWHIGFLIQGQMHAFMPAVLLRIARPVSKEGFTFELS